VTEDEAVEKLAIRMFAKMEHLDPTDDFDWDKTAEENWAALTEHNRNFFRTTVRDLLLNRDEIRAAIGENDPASSDVSGGGA